MTRKDYIAIAECIKDEQEARQRRHGNMYTNVADATLHSLAFRLMQVFKADNSRFDRDRFEGACGF